MAFGDLTTSSANSGTGLSGKLFDISSTKPEIQQPGQDPKDQQIAQLEQQNQQLQQELQGQQQPPAAPAGAGNAMPATYA